MERLTRPDVDVTEYADKFLNTRLKGKEIDWKRTNDAGIDLLINAITCDEFSKDVFRQMARDLYGRLKQFEDTGLTPKEVTALGELFDYALKESKTLSEQLTLLKHIRELAAADKEGRVVVLPPENYAWKIRGDIALGIIAANCRRAEAERALQEMEGKKDGNETSM